MNQRIGWSDRGFTLVELLVGMAMGAIVLAAVIGIFSGLSRSYTTETARATAQQDIRAAMDLMVQDIRLAGLDPLGSAGGGFVETTGTAVDFIADLDYDGAVTAGNNERVKYYLSGTQLLQKQDNDDTTAEILLDNVTELSFTYLDEDDDELTGNPSSPTIVVIAMTVREAAGRKGYVTRTLTERVRIRNV
ncbi:conserved hypothetical protein [Desulfosarcina cetonica]|uniref:PilW family protein n=1 Tax=Desulfosarcina cetonica TaxID=90730 RepID=UPI0006D25FB1|nr:prepilin-type N-terminal cleavage/methylation domain-containing protein [Desulfosarcina cetonica]VTR70811.1 conserved hypothetical protein [Desulfosarcina cetonica]